MIMDMKNNERENNDREKNDQEAAQNPFEYGSDSIADDAVNDECVDDYFNDDCCDEYDDESIANQPSLLLRIVALVTALAFLGLVAATSWPALQAPLGDLISRSLQLEKDIDIQRLQAAVVQIKVVARKQGALAPVEQKSGTGFNIDSHGIIVTNHHVVKDALNMVISFPDGKVYKAVNWVGRPEYDLAVVTLQAAELPVVPLNINEPPVSGDKIRVVGNPLGLNNIVAEGKIEQYLMAGDKPDKVFSISAPIYPGNSGSPVFDREGRVVGVVFGNLHRQVDGVDKVTGLAIPVQEVLNLHK